MPVAKSMRYAHSDGFTDVCYEESGRYILTCGSDGDVRIWDGIEDDDAISHRCGDKSFAIAIKGNRYFAATDTNTIQAYTFPDGTPDGILTRFTAPANHIVLNKSGSTLVAGASDFAIKIVEVSNCSYKTCQGHEAPILSVALDPKEEFLASSSCDGTVRIWKMSDRSQIQSFTLIPKCSDASLSKTMCRMCWEPENGKILYVPVQKEIHMYERETWKKIATLTESSFTEHVSVLAMSPDGKYLAAGGSDGWICIFSVQSKKCVDKHKNEKGLSIMSLAWNPKGNMELVFCDNQGQLGQLCDISLTENKQDDEGSSKVASGVFDDEDDDFLIQATNDEDTMASDDDMTGVTPKATQPLFSDDDGDSIPDFKKADDDDASSVTSEKSEPPRPEVRIEGFKPTPLQRAFQPGSTPEHLTSRFMVWNSVGVVRQYNNDEENSIDIEFHDTSIHHAMHVMNNFNYTMADLSTEAVVLATEGDSDTSSKLTCMHFSSWDNNKEWSISMPDDEEIQCVTLGEGWLAAATEARNLRLFSVAGVQKEIFALPGPVVCMSGHQNQLIVVYHRGMGIPGEQCLGVTLLDVREWKRDIHGEPLPLSSKSTLVWAGFSAEGTPFYMDSAGIIRMLGRNTGKTWVQVANTRTHAKGKSDNYWIVGIHENPQQIRCIPCKGSRYPATLPRPAPVILPFQIPLCELNTEKSQYEELLWRTNLLSGHFDHWTRQGFEYDETIKAEALKPAQEALMKLFALSARSEREARALEVCDMMSDQHTLQLAIKYSSRMRYMQLAQKISELAVRKAEEEEAKQYAQSYEMESRSAPYASVSRAEQYEEDNVEVTQEQDVDMEEEDEKPSGPMLAFKVKEDKQEKSQNPFKNRSNPFKVSTPHPSTALTKGTQVFDSMSKKKEKPSPLFAVDTKSSKSSQKKGSQPKLFMKKKSETVKTNKNEEPAATQKPASAFDLWLEENSDRLKETQPEAEEEEFSKYAAEQFRALAKEDRQAWVKKAKSLTEKSKENSGDTEKNDNSENKKRKRDDNDTEEGVKKHRDSIESEVKKTPLSQTTNSKLANFAFKKDES
ncbi:WD repeat and HMG-box DNA-binding protein 1-like isoform X2 [Mercenaria mercenaria]|uniref:WD repeat and HMG-box DNA-binding protein 1-like isoform X2 n=1 Tax=Mercenaria mercenaria TaxID=6596 RepID=UPI00234F679C|nr:WD repeat and HMG-box DNA-binding protein 1-like isoform X2 [Mercenaria mercenaria]